MGKAPRLVPVWLWVAVIIIIVFLCSSCRGGRSLGKGSAGTVIVPQTPQQINERNRPSLEPLPPPPIIQTPLEPIAPPLEPPTPPQAKKLPSVRSTPTTPTTSAKANPVVVNPKPAGELKSFSPTISDTATLITPPVKNLPTDNKATDPVVVLDPRESDGTFNGEQKEESFNWVELLLNYLLFIIIGILIWTIYDIIRRRGDSKVNRLTNTKLKKGRTKKKKSAIRSKKA